MLNENIEKATYYMNELFYKAESEGDFDEYKIALNDYIESLKAKDEDLIYCDFNEDLKEFDLNEDYENFYSN